MIKEVVEGWTGVAIRNVEAMIGMFIAVTGSPAVHLEGVALPAMNANAIEVLGATIITEAEAIVEEGIGLSQDLTEAILQHRGLPLCLDRGHLVRFGSLRLLQ